MIRAFSTKRNAICIAKLTSFSQIIMNFCSRLTNLGSQVSTRNINYILLAFNVSSQKFLCTSSCMDPDFENLIYHIWDTHSAIHAILSPLPRSHEVCVSNNKIRITTYDAGLICPWCDVLWLKVDPLWTISEFVPSWPVSGSRADKSATCRPARPLASRPVQTPRPQCKTSRIGVPAIPLWEQCTSINVVINLTFLFCPVNTS